MKGTVAPSSSRATAAATCWGWMPSSVAMVWRILALLMVLLVCQAKAASCQKSGHASSIRSRFLRLALRSLATPLALLPGSQLVLVDLQDAGVAAAAAALGGV